MARKIFQASREIAILQQERRIHFVLRIKGKGTTNQKNLAKLNNFVKNESPVANRSDDRTVKDLYSTKIVRSGNNNTQHINRYSNHDKKFGK